MLRALRSLFHIGRPLKQLLHAVAFDDHLVEDRELLAEVERLGGIELGDDLVQLMEDFLRFALQGLKVDVIVAIIKKIEVQALFWSSRLDLQLKELVSQLRQPDAMRLFLIESPTAVLGF